MLDAVVVGLLTSIGAVLAVLTWQLYVRPRALFELWSSDNEHAWFDNHPGPVAALRVTACMLVFLIGFMTGVALSFLSGT